MEDFLKTWNRREDPREKGYRTQEEKGGKPKIGEKRPWRERKKIRNSGGDDTPERVGKGPSEMDLEGKVGKVGLRKIVGSARESRGKPSGKGI